MFTMGVYTQVADFRSSLPIVEARRVSGREDEERDVYEVRFHDEHLRTSQSAEPGGDRVVGRWFTIRAFTEIGEATKDKNYGKRVFGFGREGMYYLVGDP